MTVYVITGKLGSGKSIAAVGKAREYLLSSRRVATNLDLYLEKLLPARNKMTVTRIPDKPRLEDLQALGTGSGLELDNYDESKFGLLILDELGSWFNARSWNDKDRHGLIEWFIHARKYHWDILLLVQDIDNIDKQLRNSLCEHLVICKRLDRVGIPIISFFLKQLTGFRLTLPRLHVASVYYGENTQALRVDRWVYRGTELYPAYRTGQVFAFDEKIHQGQLIDMRTSYTYLSSWHLRGRYMKSRTAIIKAYLLHAANSCVRTFFKILFPAWAAGPRREKLQTNVQSKLIANLYDGDKIDRTPVHVWPTQIAR